MNLKKQIGAISLVTIMSASAVFGATQIKKAEYNTNNITYNGKELALENQMVSIYENDDYFSNYMPVREVLEELGYEVNWNDSTDTVEISDNTTAKAGYYIDKYGSEVPEGYINILEFVPKNFQLIGKITDINSVLNALQGNTTVVDGRMYINESYAMEYLSNL